MNKSYTNAGLKLALVIADKIMKLTQMKVNQQVLEMKLCIPNWYSHVYVFHQVYKIIIMIIKSHFFHSASRSHCFQNIGADVSALKLVRVMGWAT